MFFGWFDAIFSFIFPILFLLFMGMFFFALISNLRTWNKNNHSPRLTVPATVVAKRTDVSHSSSANAGDVYKRQVQHDGRQPPESDADHVPEWR